MIKKIKEDSEIGLQIVKNEAQNLFRRSIQEIDSIKIRFELRKKERELENIMLQAGKIMYEKFQKGENQLEDAELISLFSKAIKIKEEEDLLKSDLSKPAKQAN